MPSGLIKWRGKASDLTLHVKAAFASGLVPVVLAVTDTLGDDAAAQLYLSLAVHRE